MIGSTELVYWRRRAVAAAVIVGLVLLVIWAVSTPDASVKPQASAEQNTAGSTQLTFTAPAPAGEPVAPPSQATLPGAGPTIGGPGTPDGELGVPARPSNSVAPTASALPTAPSALPAPSVLPAPAGPAVASGAALPSASALPHSVPSAGASGLPQLPPLPPPPAQGAPNASTLPQAAAAHPTAGNTRLTAAGPSAAPPVPGQPTVPGQPAPGNQPPAGHPVPGQPAQGQPAHGQAAPAQAAPGQPVAKGHPGAPGQPAVPVCADQDIALVAQVGAPSYRVGQRPLFRLVIANIGPRPCSRDLDPGLRGLVVNGPTGQLWANDDCDTTHHPDVRVLEPGKPLVFSLNWAGRTSHPGCTGVRQPIGPGSYQLVGKLGALSSGPAPFTLTQ